MTELGAARTLEATHSRAEAVRELLETLPFPWRLRLERLLAVMVQDPPSVLRVCRHCDWSVCRHSPVAPCPVAPAQAGAPQAGPGRSTA